jgi:hypothetical protein
MMLEPAQLERGEVRYEVGLPHVPPWAHGDELSLPLKPCLGAQTVAELGIVGEHEIVVVKGIEHERKVGHGDEPGGVPAARIEVAVASVEG